MKNSKITLAVFLITAVSLFTVGVMAASSPVEGYESFKEVVKEMKTTNNYNNANVKAKVLITDNSQTIVSTKADVKADKVNELANGTVVLKSKDQSKELDFYSKDQKVYIIDEEANGYYVGERKSLDKDIKHGCTGDKEWSASQEELVDFLMGDLKQQFEVTNNDDGSKVIKVELIEDEVPKLIKLLFAAKSDNNDRSHCQRELSYENNFKSYPFLKGFDFNRDSLPKLVDNVELKLFNLSMLVNQDNEITNLDIKANVKGQDEAGNYHDVTAAVSIDIEAINATTVDTIDTDAYDWQEIE